MQWFCVFSKYFNQLLCSPSLCFCITVVKASLSMPYKSIRDSFTHQIAVILSCYRKHCSNQSPPGQLILPESLKLLPMYSNCLLKSDALLSREFHYSNTYAVSPPPFAFYMLCNTSLNVWGGGGSHVFAGYLRQTLDKHLVRGLFTKVAY